MQMNREETQFAIFIGVLHISCLVQARGEEETRVNEEF
jgi:hypothetical protein